MGWLDDQIKQRQLRDRENFSDAMDEIASVITRKRMRQRFRSREAVQHSRTEAAIGNILEFFHVKPGELPENIRNLQEQLEYMCRPHGIMWRTVHLCDDWYANAAGAYLGTKKNGTRVALIPNCFFGYCFFDPDTESVVRLNSRTAKQLETEAICFYRPFPMNQLNLLTVRQFILKSVRRSSYVWIGAMLLISTLVGTLSPKITHIIFDEVVPSGNMQLFWAMVVFSLCVSISGHLIGIVKMLIDESVNTQMSMAVQAATMARVLSLPLEFFKQFSAGELSTKIQYFNNLCTMLYSGFMSAGFSALFSLIYIGQIFEYTPELLIPSLCIAAANVGYSIYNVYVCSKINGKSMEAAGRKNGLAFALISGIQKIRMSGAERRVFTRWTKAYTEEVRNTYGIPLTVLLRGTVSILISLTGNLIFCYIAVRKHISVADYYAFTAAYGMVSGAFSSLSGIGIQVANLKATMDQVAPIMKAVPEVSEDRKMVNRLTGRIELNHVSFRYEETMPWVLDDLSLNIEPGQYVAIVGKSGCGKSTLMRLLLGFETAQKGDIYYDRRNINDLDLKSLRQKIGVVMQNGKLFHCDIFSNITISAPGLSLKDAWEAAEFADLADDIRAMPMGMNTVISEGGGGISGGQKQRLMIARALAAKPQILMFDEATSSVDNITQNKIVQSLNRLKCTRLVIAHRLSTIRHCDRIIVMDGGKIVEDGTYDTLLAQKGVFAELVQRQQLNIGL